VVVTFDLFLPRTSPIPKIRGFFEFSCWGQQCRTNFSAVVVHAAKSFRTSNRYRREPIRRTGQHSVFGVRTGSQPGYSRFSIAAPRKHEGRSGTAAKRGSEPRKPNREELLGQPVIRNLERKKPRATGIESIYLPKQAIIVAKGRNRE
jgi:hypothetical protein